jgi:ubiquinone biosynthesis protein COQ9
MTIKYKPEQGAMLDGTTTKGRIIEAALKLAAERGWKDVSLIDIAERAAVTLTELREHFSGKAAIVRGLVRAVDDELLRNARRPQAGEGHRDALFEVIMARFDLLAPHKAAIRSIVETMGPDLGMLETALASQHWMLQAAGIDGSGPQGAVRTLGLASVYASVFRTWLEDDDPGMARTMAALDRRLRRGERNIRALEDACGAVTGLAGRIGSLIGGARRAAGAAASSARPDPGNGVSEGGPASG